MEVIRSMGFAGAMMAALRPSPAMLNNRTGPGVRSYGRPIDVIPPDIYTRDDRRNPCKRLPNTATKAELRELHQHKMDYKRLRWGRYGRKMQAQLRAKEAEALGEVAAEQLDLPLTKAKAPRKPRATKKAAA